MEQVLAILRKPANGGAGNELRELISRRFSFEEMAKRSLGSHWRDLTTDEQKGFVQLFTELLERNYIDRIKAYTDEKVIFTGERRDEGYAEVESRVVKREGQEFSIDYRLHLMGDEWKVYDVVIENISLVNNYRSQFNRVILNSSYKELIRRMKEKLGQ
ncbi:MAG: MlaC/ttg2D family ABC transporter substrate-binding protein [Candidatus Binatia bacterium]